METTLLKSKIEVWGFFFEFFGKEGRVVVLGLVLFTVFKYFRCQLDSI